MSTFKKRYFILFQSACLFCSAGYKNILVKNAKLFFYSIFTAAKINTYRWIKLSFKLSDAINRTTDLYYLHLLLNLHFPH